MAGTEEAPAAKKAKTETTTTTEWEGHTLNAAAALVKDQEGKHFSDHKNVEDLQGIGPHAEKVLAALHIESVKDLATYKYFLLARALATLAETEIDGKRLKGSVMNVDKAVMKEYQTKSLKEIVAQPVSALEGLTEAAAELLRSLGVKSIGDLATLKYCRWAEAMVLLGEEYEHTHTAVERKTERELKKLAT